MKPTKFYEEHTKGAINGPRPSQLSINKESNMIRKSSFPVPRQDMNKSSHQQQRKPVIIYTHSPKIIHTQARDFMALVQSLTGISQSHKKDEKSGSCSDNDASNSSVVTEEKCNSNPNSYLADMPLFTPSSSDMFCSPRPLFRVSSSPKMGNLFSPSFLEFMKGLPEY